MNRKLIVAPALMSKYKPSQRPEELLKWDWIGLKMRQNTKRLINQKGKTCLIDFSKGLLD